MGYLNEPIICGVPTRVKGDYLFHPSPIKIDILFLNVLKLTVYEGMCGSTAVSNKLVSIPSF
jgi:hypothetical protein